MKMLAPFVSNLEPNNAHSPPPCSQVNDLVAVNTELVSCPDSGWRLFLGGLASSVTAWWRWHVHPLSAGSAGLPALQSDPSLLTPGKIVKVPPYSDACVNGILIE